MRKSSPLLSNAPSPQAKEKNLYNSEKLNRPYEKNESHCVPSASPVRFNAFPRVSSDDVKSNSSRISVPTISFSPPSLSPTGSLYSIKVSRNSLTHLSPPEGPLEDPQLSLLPSSKKKSVLLPTFTPITAPLVSSSISSISSRLSEKKILTIDNVALVESNSSIITPKDRIDPSIHSFNSHSNETTTSPPPYITPEQELSDLHSSRNVFSLTSQQNPMIAFQSPSFTRLPNLRSVIERTQTLHPELMHEASPFSGSNHPSQPTSLDRVKQYSSPHGLPPCSSKKSFILRHERPSPVSSDIPPPYPLQKDTIGRSKPRKKVVKGIDESPSHLSEASKTDKILRLNDSPPKELTTERTSPIRPPSVSIAFPSITPTNLVKRGSRSSSREPLAPIREVDMRRKTSSLFNRHSSFLNRSRSMIRKPSKIQMKREKDNFTSDGGNTLSEKEFLLDNSPYHTSSLCPSTVSHPCQKSLISIEAESKQPINCSEESYRKKISMKGRRKKVSVTNYDNEASTRLVSQFRNVSSLPSAHSDTRDMNQIPNVISEPTSLSGNKSELLKKASNLATPSAIRTPPNQELGYSDSFHPILQTCEPDSEKNCLSSESLLTSVPLFKGSDASGGFIYQFPYPADDDYDSSPPLNSPDNQTRSYRTLPFSEGSMLAHISGSFSENPCFFKSSPVTRYKDRLNEWSQCPVHSDAEESICDNPTNHDDNNHTKTVSYRSSTSSESSSESEFHRLLTTHGLAALSFASSPLRLGGLREEESNHPAGGEGVENYHSNPIGLLLRNASFHPGRFLNRNPGNTLVSKDSNSVIKSVMHEKSFQLDKMIQKTVTAYEMELDHLLGLYQPRNSDILDNATKLGLSCETPFAEDDLPENEESKFSRNSTSPLISIHPSIINDDDNTKRNIVSSTTILPENKQNVTPSEKQLDSCHRKVAPHPVNVLSLVDEDNDKKNLTKGKMAKRIEGFSRQLQTFNDFISSSPFSPMLLNPDEKGVSPLPTEYKASRCRPYLLMLLHNLSKAELNEHLLVLHKIFGNLFDLYKMLNPDSWHPMEMVDAFPLFNRERKLSYSFMDSLPKEFTNEVSIHASLAGSARQLPQKTVSAMFEKLPFKRKEGELQDSDVIEETSPQKNDSPSCRPILRVMASSEAISSALASVCPPSRGVHFHIPTSMDQPADGHGGNPLVSLFPFQSASSHLDSNTNPPGFVTNSASMIDSPSVTKTQDNTLTVNDNANLFPPAGQTSSFRRNFASSYFPSLSCRDSTFGSTSVLSLAEGNPFLVTENLKKSELNDGYKMINEYIILKELGRGNSGKVKLAYDDRRNRTVAIKIIRKASKYNFCERCSVDPMRSLSPDRDLIPKNPDAPCSSSTQPKPMAGHNYDILQREIAIMKRLRHRNIISLYEVIDDPKEQKFYLIMQYVDEGSIGAVSLDGKCRQIDPEELMECAKQILTGLVYLHNRQVVHHDIKPENILISSDGVAYLSDFGISEVLQYGDGVTSFHNNIGTKLFMPPESFRLDNSNEPIQGKGIDVWATGITLFTLLVGNLPFLSIEEIRKGVFDVAKVNPFGENWITLLKGLLNPNAAKRWSASKARNFVKQTLKKRRLASV